MIIISPKLNTRLTVKELMAIEGYDDRLDFLEWLMSDSVVPALCSNGCQVEPDGICPDGNPSPLKVMGMY